VTTPLTPERTEEALDMMERFYNDVELPFDRERARKAIEGLARYGGWWFLEQDHETIGYFVLTIGYSLEFGGRFALLDEFFIEENWRGKGLGSAAMTEILGQAQRMGARAVHLEADSHSGVQRLYERAGFAPRGREMMTRWVDSPESS
jgi:GNAT superfamily N-acetyltransferase